MLRPLNDWLLVELEPEDKVLSSGIIKVAADPIRMGKVLAVGPGKNYPDRTVPMEVKAKQRVAFFIASAQTKQGQQLNYALLENQVLIRETDVLMILKGKVTVSL